MFQKKVSYPRHDSTIFPCGWGGILSGCRVQCLVDVKYTVRWWCSWENVYDGCSCDHVMLYLWFCTPLCQAWLLLLVYFPWSHAKVWDFKFPLVIIPHESMKKPKVSCLKFIVSKPNFLWRRAGQVKTLVHEVVGRLLAWSMVFASAGTFPMVGFHGEDLDPKSFRYAKRGQTLTGGWRQGCYPRKWL
jgi:hypothetical protein